MAAAVAVANASQASETGAIASAAQWRPSAIARIFNG